MSKTVKNIVLGFTLLSAILLAVFCIELVILNWDKGDGGEEHTISNTLPPGAGGITDDPEAMETGQSGQDGENHETNGEAGEGEGEGEGEDEDGSAPTPEDRRPPQGSRRFELMMLDDENVLVLYADEALFELTAGETDWTFSLIGNSSAALEIVSDFVPPQGVDALAEIILLQYLEDGGGEPKVGGEQQIGQSTLEGVYVSGEKNEETYEAWIYGPLAGGENGLAVVFIINYETEEQKTALYAIIDTFEMISDFTE